MHEIRHIVPQEAQVYHTEGALASQPTRVSYLKRVDTSELPANVTRFPRQTHEVPQLCVIIQSGLTENVIHLPQKHKEIPRMHTLPTPPTGVVFEEHYSHIKTLRTVWKS